MPVHGNSSIKVFVLMDFGHPAGLVYWFAHPNVKTISTAFSSHIFFVPNGKFLPSII
jgi:hypothetical protein